MVTKLSAKQETRVFWQAIAGVALASVKISYAIYTIGNRILKWEEANMGYPMYAEKVFNFLLWDNAWSKNKTHGMSVLWRFAEHQLYNVVIVDDIQKVEEFKRKDHFLLWQTSKDKYQAAFLLDRGVTAEKIKKIQDVLIEIYKGDKACKGASHSVKMPGFYNTKYLTNPPYIKLVHIGNNILYLDDVLQYYEEKIKPKEYKPKEFKSPKIITNIDLSKKKKDWWYFYNIKQDKSAADFAYAKYLMNFGLSDEEIKQILLNESDDIENRKVGHLEDYLDRTVNKAREHFQPFKSDGEN
jgi:hypothetical protein